MAASVILIILINLVCLLLLMNTIVKGEAAENGRFDVTIRDFPYLGTLRKVEEESKQIGSGYLCVVTIIRKRVLLTTATCIYGQEQDEVVAVIGNTYMKGLSSTLRVMTISNWRYHGLYKFGSLAYNIGLVFTDDDIETVKGAISYANLNTYAFKPHTKCIYCGWGENSNKENRLSNAPHAFYVWTTNKLDCYKRTLAAGVMCSYVDIPNENASTTTNTTNKLGSPLVCKRKIAGIYLDGVPDVAIYIDVHIYGKWINAAIYTYFNGIIPLRSTCCQWLIILALGISLASSQ